MSGGAEPPGRSRWTLLGRDGLPYRSATPGTLGGYRRGRTRIYGLLDCRSALRAIAAGGYVRHRVFFPDEGVAVAAGFRPCAVCLPEPYARWKNGTAAGGTGGEGAGGADLREPDVGEPFTPDRPDGRGVNRRNEALPKGSTPPRIVTGA
ncbi:hypothetical protein AB0G79_23720 [Streptomyces sp. NPDC020807]|uniref:hypothetical protein n=1 Tax=Streptomyces sp. NPDC020807 TaxID=3155119 RepID=UPI0033C9CC16